MSIDLVFVFKWLKSVISLWGVYKTTTEMILQTICLVLSNVLIKQSGKDAVMGCDAIPIHHVQTFFYQLYFNCEYEKKIRPKISSGNVLRGPFVMFLYVTNPQTRKIMANILISLKFLISNPQSRKNK